MGYFVFQRLAGRLIDNRFAAAEGERAQYRRRLALQEEERQALYLYLQEVHRGIGQLNRGGGSGWNGHEQQLFEDYRQVNREIRQLTSGQLAAMRQRK